MNKVIIYSIFVLGIVLLVSVFGRSQSELAVPHSPSVQVMSDTIKMVLQADTLPASKANIIQSAFFIKP